MRLSASCCARPTIRAARPDIVLERAGQDTLGVTTALVKPFTGRVVYCEDMAGQRYNFYAPQVWTRQRRIVMPMAEIRGTHLCNAYEVTRMNDMVAAGMLDVTEPTVVPWEGLPEAHQSMWDNRHTGATYIVNHALPAMGLRGRTNSTKPGRRRTRAAGNERRWPKTMTAETPAGPPCRQGGADHRRRRQSGRQYRAPLSAPKAHWW
jgi:hypothetical protein